MLRSIFSIILGVVLSFFILFLGFYLFVITGITPIGKDIQLIVEYQSFDKIAEAISPEKFLQLQDQVFQFNFLVFVPIVCLLAGLIAGAIARRRFWLIGLLSITPLSVLSVIMGAALLLYSIPLAVLYLGLGSLGGFIAGLVKKRKMAV
jgi:hypothetical protein